MSLCLALLLAVVAINWWQGWKPFKYPFQIPGMCGQRLSTLHSQHRRSSRRSVVDAREPPSTPSAALTNSRG
jgi:hypothetical protein